ncbi:MAG: hypothetical protein FIA96_04815 [Betaproteobacteria bacterium]|nr:hypothetical protein [Betaproteobacteria bacterium]
MNRQFFVVAAASSVVAGCTQISVTTDASSPYYQLPSNTTVIVRQTVTIPPGTAHVIIQDGRIVFANHLRRYYPYCEIEVNDVIEAEQQIRPGRFAAARIIYQQKTYGAERPPVLLAANTIAGNENDGRIGTVLLAHHNDGPSFVLNEVRLGLQSAEQPNVRELRCAGGWAFPTSVAFPTLREIDLALGALISIEID